MKKIIYFILMVLLFNFMLTGCGKAANLENETPVIRVAYQYGAAYAPLEIIKQQEMLESSLTGAQVEWVALENTAAIREAMLAGQVDIGFMAIPPFLIGYDKGMEWQIFTGLSSVPSALLSKNPDINTLGDFKETDKIAVPQPGSIQHILLSMACKKEFGDAKKMDNMLITMSHPDAAALMSSSTELSGHFTTPPYLQKEMAIPGMKLILDGETAMGQAFTFIVGAVTKDYALNHPKEVAALKSAIEKASVEVMESEEAPEILSEIYQVSQEEMRSFLTLPGVAYGTEVKGVQSFADFMSEEGYLADKYQEADLIMQK